MKNRVFIFLLVGFLVLTMAGCQSQIKQEKGSNEQALSLIHISEPTRPY